MGWVARSTTSGVCILRGRSASIWQRSTTCVRLLLASWSLGLSSHLRLHLVLHGKLLLMLQEGLIIHGLWLIVTGLRVGILSCRVAISILVDLLNCTKLVLAHLEEHVLAARNLAVDAIDFELVGVNLGLVVFELSNHLLELLSAFL